MKRGYGTAEVPTYEDVVACIEKRLFLGRLPPGITEAQVSQVFSPFGTVTECRIIPEKGVGFVGYTTWAAAHRALLSTDGQACLPGSPGSAISVSFAEKKSSYVRGAGAHLAKGHDVSRVFVGGLPEAIKDEELHAIFEPYGTVEAVSLLPAKSMRRCGFVNFSIWGEALDSIECLNGTKYPPEGGMIISVVIAQPKDSERGPKTRRVEEYVAPLPVHEQYGGWEGHGGAVSEWESLKAAYLNALDGMGPASVCDELHREIMNFRAMSRQAMAPIANASWSGYGQKGSRPPAEAASEDSNRLFVGGLPYDCTDEELLALLDQLEFSQPPEQRRVLECRVLPNKGCGYLRFSSRQAANEALQALDQREVTSWPLPLRVAWATPKGMHSAPLAPLGHATQFQGQPPRARFQGKGGGDFAFGHKLSNGGQSAAQAQEEASVRAAGMDPTRLFVGQIAPVSKTQLEQLFNGCGPVESIKLIEEKGIAYVQYPDYASAARAVQQLSGRNFPGISKPDIGLNVSFAKVR